MPFGEGVAEIGEVGHSVVDGEVLGAILLHVETRHSWGEWHAKAVGGGGEDVRGVRTAV